MAKDSNAPDTAYTVDKRNKVKRRPNRGFYDKKTVHEILDSGLLCHIAYVIDGQPYCTPTSYWREGEHIYWHGSSASRMLRAQTAEFLPVCLTVTHLDALNLARSGFNHAVNYRCVMAFGNAKLIEGERKVALMNNFIDRFYPRRSELLREATETEIKATSIVGMHIDQASAKIRDIMFGDDDEDYSIPAWTAVMQVRTVLGEIVECPRQMADVKRPVEMRDYQTGRRLDEIVREAYKVTFGE